MKVFLIGFMGSGKSYLGQRMASALQLPFVDLDDLIEQKAGCSIGEIFATEGEEHFRHLERSCLKACSELETAMISTGGGAPCFFDNMSWMNNNGLTVYLQAPASLLADRLQEEMSHRPLLAHLSHEELLSFVGQKLKQRSAYYLQAKLHWHQERQNQEDWPMLVEKIRAILSGKDKN